MTDPTHLTRMQRFWSWLALWLGRHAGIVALVGLLVTLVLGYGTARLQFATGQDSYLNRGDQIAIDNVEYQSLFGGQAVLVLFTMDEGSTVSDLMSPQNQAEMDRIAVDLSARPELIQSVISPKTALDWTDRLLRLTPEGQVAPASTASAAGVALLNSTTALTAGGQPQSAESVAARTADAIIQLERLGEIPEPIG